MTKVFGVAVLLAISFGVGVVTALLIITIGNLASKADVAAQVRIPPLRNERFFGTQRLLAVRVFSSTTNEYPDETLDDMQEAIFCNSSRLDNSTNHSMTVSAAMTSCVTRQFGATSHGQLNYVPASHANLARPGLVELDIGPVPSNVTMNLYNHTYWQAVLVPTMQQALATLLLADNRTTSTTTNSATIDLDAAQVGPTIQSVADRVMYCLPTGSLSQGTGGVAGVGGMVRFFS
jgi:hypothetical protein